MFPTMPGAFATAEADYRRDRLHQSYLRTVRRRSARPAPVRSGTPAPAGRQRPTAITARRTRAA